MRGVGMAIQNSPGPWLPRTHPTLKSAGVQVTTHGKEHSRPSGNHREFYRDLDPVAARKRSRGIVLSPPPRPAHPSTLERRSPVKRAQTMSGQSLSPRAAAQAQAEAQFLMEDEGELQKRHSISRATSTQQVRARV